MSIILSLALKQLVSGDIMRVMRVGLPERMYCWRVGLPVPYKYDLLTARKPTYIVLIGYQEQEMKTKFNPDK